MLLAVAYTLFIAFSLFMVFTMLKMQNFAPLKLGYTSKRPLVQSSVIRILWLVAFVLAHGWAWPVVLYAVWAVVSEVWAIIEYIRFKQARHALWEFYLGLGVESVIIFGLFLLA